MKDTLLAYSSTGAIIPLDGSSAGKIQSVMPYDRMRRKSRWEEGDAFKHGKKDSQLSMVRGRLSSSKWSIDKSFTPPPLTYIPDFLTQDQLEIVLRQYRIEDISRRLTANDYDIQDHDVRSPSPEPIYDPKTGQRINTREYRAKEKLITERNTCIEECMRIDPLYKPPGDYVPPKKIKKLYIPINGDTPAQSYVSLILGPRGATQKALEKRTKCKIYIRGRGASRGKNYTYENEEEPMHVLIQADTEEDLERCCDILEPILNGRLDDEENRNRRMQLMQMASDTRKAIGYKTDWCEICGEQGHKKYVCPNRHLAIAYSKCESCGDSTHSTQDCPGPKRKKRKTIEEQLEEFNRATGACVTLTSYDMLLVKSHKQRTNMPTLPVEEPEEVIQGDEDLLPPGVDPSY